MTRYALLDALGEVYAVEDFWATALLRKIEAEEYLDEAATCGHPDAPPWVAKRLPFVVRPVTDEQAEDLLADGVPVLDREP